jgi:hypothetical protein
VVRIHSLRPFTQGVRLQRLPLQLPRGTKRVPPIFVMWIAVRATLRLKRILSEFLKADLHTLMRLYERLWQSIGYLLSVTDYGEPLHFVIKHHMIAPLERGLMACAKAIKSTEPGDDGHQEGCGEGLSATPGRFARGRLRWPPCHFESVLFERQLSWKMQNEAGNSIDSDACQGAAFSCS